MPNFKGYYETKNLDPFTLEKAYEALNSVKKECRKEVKIIGLP